MKRRCTGWPIWLACVPVVAQVQPDGAAPLADRVAAFVAAPTAVARPDFTCQDLVSKIASKDFIAAAAEKLALLDQLHAAAGSLTQETRAFLALAAAGQALQLGDHERSIREAQVAASVTGDQRHARSLRQAGLRLLFQQALRIGDIASAFPYLDRYAEVADPCDVGIAEVDLLLRVGMIKDAAVALDRLESLEADAQQAQRIAVLRLQEHLANEQFEQARSGAERLLREGALSSAVELQVRLTDAFAMVRMGEVEAAANRLQALLALPGLGAEHAPLTSLARAELAMLHLQGGESPEVVSEELGADPDAPLHALPDWSLAARARVLLAMAPGAVDRGALAAVHAELLHRHRYLLRQWRATPVLSSGVAFLQWSVRRELLVCLCACEVALGEGAAAEACLRYLLEADACGSLARELGLTAAAPEILLQRVRPHDGLLLWFVPAPRGSLAMLVDDAGARAVALPGDMSLRAQVRELRVAVRDETLLGATWREPLAALGAPLADWLYQPELRAALAANRRVRIIGRELLTGLPFEFLSSPTDGRQWLGHTHAIDYVPSATLATAPRSPVAARAPARIALLATGTQDETSSQRYPGCAVPLAAQQLAAIAAAVDAGAVQVAADADRAKLLAALEDADVLIVLAHGKRRNREDVVDARQRHRPLGIVLGDGFFGPEHLQGLTRMPSVIVLASCGTARAGVDRGEDGQLFGTAWLAAGASMVLSAEGDLELQSTQRLLAALVAALVRGVEPAEALRQARVEVAAEPGRAHPALHCALRLDVAGGAMELRLPAASASRARQWQWAVGAGLASLAALLFTGRRLRGRLRTARSSPRH